MYPRQPFTIPLPGRAPLSLGERTLVMGILNITPDSFADGGLHFDPDRAIAAGIQMVEDGADLIDVGGESTQPGAEMLAADEELHRALPVIERLVREVPVPISIDTYKAVVAREACARGATIVNDISGLLFDDALGDAIAEAGAAAILMHNRGRSRDMYKEAIYVDVAEEMARELEAAIDRAMQAGVSRDRLILDPGFGFAKRAEHSYEALAHLDRLAALGRPILSGPSRKSFLKQAIGERLPAGRDWATAAAVTASVLLGAHIVRVHAVREMVDVVRVADRLLRQACTPRP
jgi:dihydropteroate synthase